ncbi:MAG: DUF3791 domain-containing protein [Bacilli bacterium]
MLSERTNLLQEYIIPLYDILHTQGEKYIVHDLIDRLKEEGVEF